METISREHNIGFWEEVCGTAAFRDLNLKEVNPKTLKVFDSWYLDEKYSYLYKYLPFGQLGNKDVLEIGLGLGTVGEKLFLSAKSYVGVDYARNPVQLMRQRIKTHCKENVALAVRGDARALPFVNECFDFVVSIGCLHHTGDIPKSLQEIHRVLKKGAHALVMLYNKNSCRRIFFDPLRFILLKIARKNRFKNYKEFVRYTYDSNAKGDAAPVTEFVSKKDLKNLFSVFSEVSFRTENFENIYIPGTRLVIPRKRLLNNIGKILGLDFYISAKK